MQGELCSLLRKILCPKMYVKICAGMMLTLSGFHFHFKPIGRRAHDRGPGVEDDLYRDAL